MSDTPDPAAVAKPDLWRDYTEGRLLVAFIRGCARPAGKARIGVGPRWAVVSAMTGLGSTYAAMLCRYAGCDPDELVVRRRA